MLGKDEWGVAQLTGRELILTIDSSALDRLDKAKKKAKSKPSAKRSKKAAEAEQASQAEEAEHEEHEQDEQEEDPDVLAAELLGMVDNAGGEQEAEAWDGAEEKGDATLANKLQQSKFLKALRSLDPTELGNIMKDNEDLEDVTCLANSTVLDQVVVIPFRFLKRFKCSSGSRVTRENSHRNPRSSYRKSLRKHPQC